MSETIKEDKNNKCHLCGGDFEITSGGIANHIDENGNIDHDEDARHVPYMLEEDVEDNVCTTCGYDMGEGYVNCGASEDGVCPECWTDDGKVA